jgi:small subunit ribosomal protein S4
VTHRHFEVNGRIVNVPSYQVRVGDVIKVREGSSDSSVFDAALDAAKGRQVPSWLSFNEEEKSGKVLALPERDEMEMGVEEHLIVEFYSR